MAVSCGGMCLLTMDTPVWVAAAWNTLRTTAIGCLMMPLVTWGTEGIGFKKLSHGTALLTSLRTVAGAMGTAVFVGIMTVSAQDGAGKVWGRGGAPRADHGIFLDDNSDAPSGSDGNLFREEKRVICYNNA